ncbi:MAG: hypothetical protein JNG89_02325 [Planctomycetaceae bacterium]|nr:hypothetical protein [Planctomycetaceae bacterium]
MTAPRFDIPPEIQDVLERLRDRIRKYVLIEGISAVVALLCIVFWATLSLDVAYFAVRKLELPGWFRTLCTIAALSGLTAAAVVWVLVRSLRRFRSRALALVLERQFPQLGDRLITAVELAGGRETDTGELGGAMLERTIADAARSAAGLDLESVFDRRPMYRWLIGGLVLLVSVAGFGAVRADAMERWFNAFVLLRSDYWEPYRKSAMSVRVLVQPGDRLKEFGQDGYKHPRGADLTLVADASEGRELPEAVSLSYRVLGNGESRGDVAMTQSGDRRFRHTLGRVIENHELWVAGGDFINREAYRVIIVEPPQIGRIVLHCDYPDYTGLDAITDRERVVESAQVSLPAETSFVMQAEANKPLVAVQLRSPHFDLEFCSPLHPSPIEATLTIHPQAGESDAQSQAPRRLSIPADVSRNWFTDDGKSFRIPLVLATRGLQDLQSLASDFAAVPVPPDTTLQLYLEDVDDVATTDPLLLTLVGIPDTPPVVESRRSGVDTSVTRLAEIPVIGRIRDDYGIASARFEYKIDDAAEFTARPFAVPPAGQKDFVLGESSPVHSERFTLQPLELKVDQQLTLTVAAEDGDNLNGPHVSRGEVFTFTVVTPEELLAQLYDKELNLRLRFEQIRREVQAVRDDLALHLEQHNERVRLATESVEPAQQAQRQEEIRRLTLAISASAERSLHAVGKTSSESRAVEIGFAGIREEMVNNRVSTSLTLQRIDDRILQPLGVINGASYPELHQRIGLFKLANANNSDPSSAISTSIIAAEGLLARMDAVLANMREREGINEMIKLLEDIRNRTRTLRNETQQEQERRLFDLLGTEGQ